MALALSGLAVGLDLTILNVALPTLASSLQASTSDLQWFSAAYNLVLAAMLIPAGLLGDRYGRKKLLCVSLVLFGLASVGCAYATSVGELIAARAVLGLGAAFLTPLSISILTVLFPPEQRQKAIGITILANTIGMPLGPIIGGLLLNHFWWGSVFLINVPLILVSLPLATMLIPESRSAKRPRIDIGGVASSSLGLAGVTYGVIEGSDKGWSDSVVIASLVIGTLMLILFAFTEWLHYRRKQESLIDVSLLCLPAFTWGIILTALMTFSMFGLLFTMPQYLQVVRGYSALNTGLSLLPVILGLFAGTRVSDRLVHLKGLKATIAIGFVISAIGYFIAAQTGFDSSYWLFITWGIIIGLGMGVVIPTAMGAALSEVSAERSGVASSFLQAVRTIGGVLGVAILGTVLGTVYQSSLDTHKLPAVVATTAASSVSAGTAVASKLHSDDFMNAVFVAFTHASDFTLIISGVIALLCVVLTLLFVPRTSRMDERPASAKSA